jgi:pyruvate,water dikinase
MLIALRDADPARCGGKAATLGRLLSAGLPVPDGVVVPFGTGAPDLECRAHGAWDALAPGPLAVRSSADGEDSPDASMAGQHTSVLGASTPAEVAEGMRACLASVSSARAVAYRWRTGAREPRMAILVQRQVPADAAGVMFMTASGAVIEAAHGLGTGVVEGHVTPDRYRVDLDGTVHRPRSDGGGPARGGAQVLDDGAMATLVTLGRAVTALLGADQDIEWALADGDLWILQARPITAPLPDAATVRPGVGDRRSCRLTGSPGSTGTATGPARVVRGPADFARVRPGDILVCPYTDPAWTPLLAVAAGVVTRTGGVLSHAAIVARELGVPAVVGVPEALDRIVDGDPVTLDGDAGTVTVGRPA